VLDKVFVEKINVEATVKKVQMLLEKEAHLPPALRSVLDASLLMVTLVVNRLTLNSRNSSKPPSADGNQKGDKFSILTSRAW
jgi:transposase